MLIGFRSFALQGDANLDGKIDSADKQAIADHLSGAKLLTGFELLSADANRDGVVTLNEYLAAATGKFKELDVAGNGRVTAEEMANSPLAHKRAEHVAERIARRLDTNGDGRVSKDEFLATAKARFAKLDKNGDGFLSADEIGRRR